jgi:hypothetical protein
VLSRAERIQWQIQRAKTTIGALNPDSAAGLPALLAHAERVFREVANDAGLSFAEATLRDLWRKIPIADVARQDEPVFIGTDSFLPVAEDKRSGASSLPAPLVEAGAATAAIVLALAVVAVMAVASASFLPKDTFGTVPAYIALFISGFGSSTAASALVALLLWQRTKKA